MVEGTVEIRTVVPVSVYKAYVRKATAERTTVSQLASEVLRGRVGRRPIPEKHVQPDARATSTSPSNEGQDEGATAARQAMSEEERAMLRAAERDLRHVAPAGITALPEVPLKLRPAALRPPEPRQAGARLGNAPDDVPVVVQRDADAAGPKQKRHVVTASEAAEIDKLFHQEHRSVRQIATQMGLNYYTVYGRTVKKGR